MSKNLMIVESPAKAKTIEKYLGEGFTVKSCYGHIRDLAKGDKAIDIENNYNPIYEVSKDKKEVVKELKKAAKGAEVWLATDEDREGEAISWHLCEVLGLNEKETKRIVFHEITKPAILNAVQNPRLLNKDLVNAQQARRVLDRLVGFGISPILWRKIARSGSLSAGRVQSVAVRIVVEREREIRNFEVMPHFKITAFFEVKDAQGKKAIFKAELAKKIDEEATVEAFLKDCMGAAYAINDIKVKPGKKSPPAPYTTSTLQQEASRKLGFSVTRTMRVAQKLYEAGHITYMRTDSTNLSDTARTAAHSMIGSEFGDKYVQPRVFKTKSESAQEAHEAIRPTYFDKQTAGSDYDEERLYSLIWKRAVASQMADAELERTTARVGISTRSEELVGKGEVLKFDGFLKLYREAIDEDEAPEERDMLPPLTVGQVLDLKEMEARERFNRAAPRYSEATLVKKLEELGIGRPSTYAPTISTIQKRGYVIKEDRDGVKREYTLFLLDGKSQKIDKKIESENTGFERQKLFPTDTGIVVNDFLLEHFPNVLNYDFTAKIEEEFDEIADGKKEWNQMIDNFYKPFHKNVEETMETAERASGERELGIHPKSGKPIIARLGRFGPMVQIGGPEDEEKEYSAIRYPLTLETVTLEQALELFKLPRTLGEFEGHVVKAATGRFGPYVVHNKLFCSLKKDSGLTPLEITLEEAIEVIKNKRIEDAKKLIKEFDDYPDIRILHGRWGPYIKAGKQNVKIPKEKKETPEELTIEEVLKLIEEAPKKPARGRGASKAKATTPAKTKAAPKTKAGTKTTTTAKTKASPKGKTTAKPKASAKKDTKTKK
ncbi:MAG: type I DNA topoisomerase [Chitinophagales bacterium]